MSTRYDSIYREFRAILNRPRDAETLGQFILRNRHEIDHALDAARDIEALPREARDKLTEIAYEYGGEALV